MNTDEVRSDLELAVVRFRGVEAAYEAFAEARGEAGPDAPWVHEVGFVEHHQNGKLVLRGVFAGHYVEVDETAHVSEKGAGEGAVAGGLVGLLGGPPGLAVGLVLGAIVGSQLAESTETDPEPQVLVDHLLGALPRSSSAIVMIAPPRDVEEMLAAIGVIRQRLTRDQVVAIEASLSEAPAESRGPSRLGERAVEASDGPAR
jgi:uncharacterized membrane protein